MAAPSHRHQSSLEGIIDFNESAPIFENEQQRHQAIGRFRRIVEYLEGVEVPVSRYGQGYNRPALVRLTYEYARSPESQDRFLKAFFTSLALGMLDDDNSINLANDGEVASLGPLVFKFANHLIDHFFLPLRASTCKTPQPTPPHHAAFQQVHSQEEQQRIQDFVGTPERLGTLRGLCLTRDRHRCVITHTFDFNEVQKRSRQPPARDDDGNILEFGGEYVNLEVAHIIPFGLAKGESKDATLAILNMFDVGIIHLIEGADIDRPRNAITLTLDMHVFFGSFKIFFEPVTSALPHTYHIQSFSPYLSRFPITRSFFVHPSIDPPLERLLALHSAIGHILHLSGAGDYIDNILRDMEDGVVREDGSTQLGAMVQVALQIKG